MFFVLVSNIMIRLFGSTLVLFAVLVGPSLAGYSGLAAQTTETPEVPEMLEPWKGWVLWGTDGLKSPSVYNDRNSRIQFWPSELSLSATAKSADWEVALQAYSETWVPLPGSSEVWPREVKLNGAAIVVVERDGRPVVKVGEGKHTLSGQFAWQAMPQSIPIPSQVGLLSLEVDGKAIEFPKWDSNGAVWLRRRSEPQEKNLLAVQVYRVIEDGVPMWLTTDVELKVSGKSREENLGWVLPAGWQLATVESPLPVAIDQQGQAKAQVRAGKWTVTLRAFRTDDAREFEFSEGAKPIIDMELVGFKSQPSFRVAELTKLRPVDVNQTTWPAKWKSFPVFQWDTSQSFGLDERMKGMGDRRTDDLHIQRTVWLDEDGAAATFHDQLNGNGQLQWRFDIAPGQELGAVRIAGTGQLITTNPTSGDRGVEVRSRNLKLDAVSRGSGAGQLLATGWQADADSLSLTWNLPPGWRMLALFGADQVSGDWLTAWSLLDLFLLLVFSLAVFRIWGLWAGVLAFLAFGLAYHEPTSPRLTWLFLLVPVALLKVIPEGVGRNTVNVWRFAALGLLLLHLTPFVTSQIQTALFPQLESPGAIYGTRSVFPSPYIYRSARRRSAVQNQPFGDPQQGGFGSGGFDESQSEYDSLQWGAIKDRRPQEFNGQQESKSMFDSSNMQQLAKARIQTGPAQPAWTWNPVYCSWDGPVSADQTIQPIFLTRNQHRVLNVVRILLLIALVAVMSGLALPKGWFGFRRMGRKATVTASVLLGLLLSTQGSAIGQEFPSPDMLRDLRSRLLHSDQSLPIAADLAAVNMKVAGGKVDMEAQVHVASRSAVPLPGKLPTWSPLTVLVDGQPAKSVCRKDGYLWVVLEPGVHDVSLKAILPDVADWEWTFLLKPRFVNIEADGWTVTGVGPNGVPETQVFFSRQLEESSAAAAYDQKNFNAIVAIDRTIETGLTWQVRNTATRISPKGKAVSISVPLLAGESVLSSDVKVKDGSVLIRMAADQESVSWTSDLPIGKDIALAAAETTHWVERWHLVTSPVWNVSFEGLEPIFESNAQHLVPVWLPWPGGEVTLAFSQPEAVVGETITVQKVDHTTVLGSRQRKTTLEITLECSLGDDFPVTLPDDVEIESVQVGGRDIPVLRKGQQLIVPVQPGAQVVKINWRSGQVMETNIRPSTVSLPYESANISSAIHVPASRWVLWADGPTRGPAVQFWVILIFAFLAALILGGISFSPLGRLEWVLLVIGLTQVHIFPAMLVVGWLLLLGLRANRDFSNLRDEAMNGLQVALVVLTMISIGVLIAVVSEGLLGRPEMFIRGNGSHQHLLQWFQPRSDNALPQPLVISTSVWVYRFLMLVWALWLASALLRWLKLGWQAFAKDGYWRDSDKKMKRDEIIDATRVVEP